MTPGKSIPKAKPPPDAYRFRMRLALLLTLAPLAALAESAPAHFYLAADPLPYVLHGFSLHGGAVLPGGRFSVEVALFSSRLSESLQTLVEPGNQGFTADLKGVTVEGYWHAVQWTRNALLLGAQLHFDRFAAHFQGEPGEGTLDQIYAFPTLAFRAFPFEGVGFFVKPFVSAGLPLLGARTAAVGAHTFHQLRVFPLATVILGWEF